LGGPGGRFFKKAPLAAGGTLPYNPKPYHFLRDLTPKYITPNYRYGGNELQAGIFLSGQDLSYEHSFSMSAFYGFRSETFNFDFVYIFDGWYPTLTLEYFDLSDYNRSSDGGNFVHNEKKSDLAALWPLRVRNRSRFYLYSSIHTETITDKFPGLSGENGLNRLRLNGIKLGLFYHSAKRYYDSISLSDGVQVSLSYSREMKALGSDYNIHTAALEYKHYLPLFRPNVLAFRAAAADSWGEASRVFYMGGVESYLGFQTAGTDLFQLMRGYPSGFFAGTGGYLVNLEYRLSLWKIEKAFLINSSLERFWLTVFTDLGNVWNDRKTINPSYSVGLELNMAVSVGDLKLDFSGGGGIGLNPYHTPVFYLRIGSSF
jgi:outer membrane protein assembly factor BamA